MKKIFYTIIAFVPGLICSGQVTPESMISKIPSIQSVCGMRTAEKDKYMSDISEVSKMIDDELRERRLDQKAREKEYKEQAQANVASQYGLSQADMDQMKNSKNMSKEERDRQRKEMATKMMNNSGGITMGEIDNIKGDTAAQKAWAQGYSTQKMAEQSVDPQNTQKEQLHSMNMNQLVSAQKRLSDSLNAAEGKYMKKFDELEKDITRPRLYDQIDSLQRELSSLMGVDYGQGDRIEALFSSIKGKCNLYCNKYSSPFIDVLKDYRLYANASIPAWNRLQDITMKIAELQTGVKIQEKKGTMALECLKRYMDKLSLVDQYYLMSPAQNVNGNED